MPTTTTKSAHHHQETGDERPTNLLLEHERAVGQQVGAEDHDGERALVLEHDAVLARLAQARVDAVLEVERALAVEVVVEVVVVVHVEVLVVLGRGRLGRAARELGFVHVHGQVGGRLLLPAQRLDAVLLGLGEQAEKRARVHA